MKRKCLAAAFLIGCVFAAVVSLPKKEGLKVEAKRIPAQARLSQQEVVPDPPGTIEGRRNPELISDRAAYTVLFLVLANRKTPQEAASARAYLTRFDAGLSDSDLASLISAATEYRQRVSVFDGQVKVIKDSNWPRPSPAVFVKLRGLQAAKEALIQEIASSLRHRLSSHGMNVVTDQVLPHIKSMTKLAPEPRSLPGGEDWEPRGSHH